MGVSTAPPQGYAFQGAAQYGTAGTYTAAQTFQSSILKINNPANTFAYTFVGSALTGNINVTLPLLTSNDTFLMAAFAQVVTNKKIDTTNTDVDATDNTKVIGWTQSGMTTGVTLTFSFTQSTTQTLSFPNITGADTVAVITLAQTIKNKKFDSSNTDVDAADTTKAIGYSQSGMTTGVTLTFSFTQSTSQTLSFPNITGADTVAVLTLAQTLSNKTIASPIFSGTATGTYTLGGTPTISSTTAFTSASPFSVANGQTLTFSVTAQTSGAATLTIPNFAGVSDTFVFTTLAQVIKNKDLDTTCSHVDATDVTKEISFNLTGMTTNTELTFVSSQTTAQNITIPNITGADTLATLGLGQTFTGLNVHSKIDSGSFVVDHTDNTKKFAFLLSGMTTAITLTFSSSQSTSQTLTVPNISAADTLATLGLAQTFTKQETFSSALTTPVSITASSAPVGSASVYVGALTVPANTLGFITTPQTGNYYSNSLGQITLTNPSSGTIPIASTLYVAGAPIASTNVTITNNYAIYVAAGASLFQTAALVGKITTYNNIATAGIGTTTVFAVTSQKAESALDNNVLTYTPPAVAGSYRLRFVLSVSAATAAVLGWTATWKDSNGNAQAPANLAIYQSGVFAGGLTITLSAAGNLYGYIDIDIDNSATNIVVKLTFSGTSFSGKATATIEQLV